MSKTLALAHKSYAEAQLTGMAFLSGVIKGGWAKVEPSAYVRRLWGAVLGIKNMFDPKDIHSFHSSSHYCILYGARACGELVTLGVIESPSPRLSTLLLLQCAQDFWKQKKKRPHRFKNLVWTHNIYSHRVLVLMKIEVTVAQMYML